MGIPDKTGKSVYKGPQHKNAAVSDDASDFNLRQAIASRQRVIASEEVAEDYAIEGKKVPAPAARRK